MSTQQQISYHQLFNRSQLLFRQRKLLQSAQLYQKILTSSNKQIYNCNKQINNGNKQINSQSKNKYQSSLIPCLEYNSLINLSTIYLQLNDCQKSRQYLIKAIRENVQRYEAFYNLSIYYHFLINKQNNQSLNIGYYNKCRQALKYCISILSLQVGIKRNDIKYINKSISLNKYSYKSYIQRALYYQTNNKIKLAINQFQNLTHLHQQLNQQNQQNQSNQMNNKKQYKFSNKELTQIYAQKALFYRRLNQIQKVNQNLTLYHKYKQLSTNSNQQIPFYIKSLIQFNKEQTNLQTAQQMQSSKWQQTKQQIKQLMQQVQQLIHSCNTSSKQSKQTKQTKDKLNLQNKTLTEKQIQNKNSQGNQINYQSNLLQSQIPNQPSKSKSIHDSSHLHNDSHLHNQSQIKSRQNQHQSYPSISVNQDQDSAILNQKIQQLQRQIKLSGGNVPEIKDLSRNSQQENFLQFQIQKTIQQINQKKIEQQSKIRLSNQSNKLSNKISVNQTDHNDQFLTQSSHSQAQNIRHSIQNDTHSLKSKISQAYQLNQQQMKRYHQFQLQIRSLTMFDQKSPKKQAYTKIKYLLTSLVTQKCKNDKLTWNHNFDPIQIKHQVINDDQQDYKYQLSLQVHAKQGGWLSWHNDVLLGTGTIKLYQKGLTKCTLQNKGKKVGMLYYKVKLIKIQ